MVEKAVPKIIRKKIMDNTSIASASEQLGWNLSQKYSRLFVRIPRNVIIHQPELQSTLRNEMQRVKNKNQIIVTILGDISFLETQCDFVS